jgi:catechol 2,3-dioxygenase-like lactoylglutathione lyase family enzyme
MPFASHYPIIVTEKMAACRDFYLRHLGLDLVFESSWFVLLGDGERGPVLAFMTPDHPSAPPGPEEFSGKGMCLELQVEDARAAHQRMTDAGLAPTLSLRDEPFGQRRFGFHDPAGLWVDVVEQIDPQEGFWDRYMVA